MNDEIVLTLPRERPYFRVAHLVLGGLAVRLDLTFEHLEDLQLALAGVLDGSEAPLGELTVAVAVEQGTLLTRVGPFDPDRLHARLERERAGDDEIGLRRLLETVADGVAVEDDDDGAWIAFTKHVEVRPA